MKPAEREPYLKIGDVARLVGVSPSVIRSWESLGLTHPRRTASRYRLYGPEDVKLLKLARFLKTNILGFFDPAESSIRLVSPDKRKVLEAGPGVRMELLAWGNTVMEPHLFRIAPQSGSGESYTHEGEEFLYILRGELQISLEEEEYRLQPGDSFYFESATPHRWKNPGRGETWVLWVNTPPTF